MALAAEVHVASETVARPADDLPRAVVRMLSAATYTGDEAQIAAVVAAAKSAYPQHAEDIDALVVELQVPVEPLRIKPLIVPAPQPVELERPGYWEDFNGEVTLNAAETKGNSDTLYLGLNGKINMMRRAQIHRVEAYANTAEANGVTNQDNWGASYQLDTLWTDAYFGYIRGSIARDDFAGFETTTFAGIGAGAYLVQNETVSLRSELGPGYRFLDIANSDRTIEALGLYSAAELDWRLDDDWTLELDTKVNLSGPTTTVQPTLSMSAAVSDHLRAGMSYDVRYESNPPLMTGNFDRILKLDVKYLY